MTNYRNSKLIERYEDVIFELDNALNINPANGSRQKKEGYVFTVDNAGESVPLDWYHARFNVDFAVDRVADGAALAADDRAGTVNSASSLIKKINVKMNGIDVYDCNEANHVTNIKNLLEYSQGYANSQGSNEYFYIDVNRQAEDRIAQVANYNKGFAARKAFLNGANASVNAEIPLNRYGFFEALHSELLPNSRIEFKIDLETDANFIWRSGGTACRVVLSKFQLIVPRIVFNASGKSLYMEKYLDTRKWTYLREMVQTSNSGQLRSGTFKISTAINKPRHVFVFLINDANDNSETENKFLYNTFNVANARHITTCHLEVGNGKDYPEVHYRPNDEPTRVFRDVMKYVHANSDYAGDTLLTRTNFGSIFSFIYFDLTKQPTDVKDGMTRLTFKYTLNDQPVGNYQVYSLILYEQDVELRKTDGRLVLRDM